MSNFLTAGLATQSDGALDRGNAHVGRRIMLGAATLLARHVSLRVGAELDQGDQQRGPAAARQARQGTLNELAEGCVGRLPDVAGDVDGHH